jgi:hypothetical protein
MSNTDNGGAAFPVAGLSGLPNDNFIHPQEGMTLRDYFAAAALSGNVGYWNEFAPAYAQSLQHTAQVAYRIADAMLAARKEGL